jgi:hypothetical protein
MVAPILIFFLSDFLEELQETMDRTMRRISIFSIGIIRLKIIKTGVLINKASNR